MATSTTKRASPVVNAQHLDDLKTTIRAFNGGTYKRDYSATFEEMMEFYMAQKFLRSRHRLDNLEDFIDLDTAEIDDLDAFRDRIERYIDNAIDALREATAELDQPSKPPVGDHEHVAGAQDAVSGPRDINDAAADQRPRQVRGAAAPPDAISSERSTGDAGTDQKPDQQFDASDFHRALQLRDAFPDISMAEVVRAVQAWNEELEKDQPDLYAELEMDDYQLAMQLKERFPDATQADIVRAAEAWDQHHEQSEKKPPIQMDRGQDDEAKDPQRSLADPQPEMLSEDVDEPQE